MSAQEMTSLKLDSDDAFAALRAAIDHCLSSAVDLQPPVPQSLRNAVNYALLGPSKRVRPVVVHLVACGLSRVDPVAMQVGAAVEMVHTASLILDDLPCMDDATTRRQRPATHLVYGEATAILASIALLNRAFGILAGLDIPDPATRLRLIHILEDAVGWNGLVAGQELDILGNVGGDRASAEHLNWLKTGVLFCAAAEMGGILVGLNDVQLTHIRDFARELGLAFQMADDLIDRTATEQDAGKDVGKDVRKTNVVNLLGIEASRQACADHLARADHALVLSGIDPAPVRALIGRHFKLSGAA
jgi:geranylgeranyl diphosphate synthase type II